MFYKEETSPCQVEEDDQTNILQGKLRLLGLLNFVAMMTNRARLRHGTPFGADALFCEDIQSLLSNSASRSGPRLPDAPCAELVLLPQGGDWCFPQQVNVRQKKKKETRKRGRKNISFRADCKFRGPKSQRFLNQKVFVLSSAPFLTMLRRRRARSWDFPCVCTLTSSACAGRAPRRFWLSKTDLKTALLAK